jgi:broad specificity phosphatase PhoE
MKLIFVRHGQSEANAAGILAGQEIDSPLTDMGREQVRATREKLTMHIDRIISSPLSRAAQTAAIINEELGLPLEYRDEIKEISNGSLSSHTWAEAIEITRDLLFEHHDLICAFDYRPYGGESGEDVKVRVKSFVESLLPAHKDETILVTAHGGIINTMYALYPTKEVWSTENAALHEFDF